MFAQEDVLLSEVGIDELEFCLVVLVGEGVSEDLVERGAKNGMDV